MEPDCSLSGVSVLAAVTVKVKLAVILSSATQVTVIVVSPAPRKVTLPSAFTVATKALELVNNKSLLETSAGAIVAISCNLSPTSAIGALELLECEKEREAIFLAAGLRDLNESRKEMTEQGMKEAIEQVETMGYNKDKVMVVYLPHCHESLAGIIAGRIREKYSRPAFVLTDGEEGVKGSGRSMECYHMYEEMTRCKELFTKYGGHKLAAGLSMERENVDIFRKRMNENCKLEEEEFQEKILIDIALPLSYVTKDFLKELDLLEPFGMGNQKPVFAQKEISFLSMRIMGKNKDMAKFVVEDKEQNRFQLVLFRKLDEFLDKVEEKYGRTAREALYAGRSAQTVKMNIIYYPNLNCFMGKEEIQFIMQHWN